MKKLLQLFNENRSKTREYSIENAGEEATIYLYDAVGGWFGIDAQQFTKDLNAITSPTIHLRINSPGGDVFDARAMVTAIRAHKSNVVAHIDGLAASAASYIALAADKVEISQGAFLMIHQAWTLAMGNSGELRGVADLLDKVDASIVRDYMQKSGKTEDQVRNWMSAETWFTADEAKENGFVDSIFEPESATENKWNLAAYDNAPAALIQTKDTDHHRATLERRLALIERIG